MEFNGSIWLRIVSKRGAFKKTLINLQVLLKSDKILWQLSDYELYKRGSAPLV
jgi:hypothetical protein